MPRTVYMQQCLIEACCYVGSEPLTVSLAQPPQLQLVCEIAHEVPADLTTDSSLGSPPSNSSVLILISVVPILDMLNAGWKANRRPAA